MTCVRIRSRRLLAALLLALTAVLALGPTTTASAASRCGDACKIAAAQAYIDALSSHDASAVPFGRNCTRVENGLRTGTSGSQLRTNLDTGLQYAIIQGATTTSVSVKGDVVTTDYVLRLGVHGIDLGTSPVHETFLVQDGLITRIVATFGYRLP